MLELCRHILYVGITSTVKLELCRHIFEMLELRRHIEMAGIDNLGRRLIIVVEVESQSA